MEVKKREEIDDSLKWNLEDLAKDFAEVDERLEKLEKSTEEFISNYKGKIVDEDIFLKATEITEKIYIEMSLLGSRVALEVEADMTNEESIINLQKVSSILHQIETKISFFDSEIAKLDDKILDKAGEKDKSLKKYIEDIKREKKHKLGEEAELVIKTLEESFQIPYNSYNMAKNTDMKFGEFKANGKDYPLSYNQFENFYEYEKDTSVRREAYKAFHEKLEDYKNVTASIYLNHLKTEKALGKLRGFPSTIDYLLFPQEVSPDLYNRQLDVIMEKLAPHMRKYASIIKRAYGLDKMTLADIKLDPYGKEKKVNLEDCKNYILEGLSAFGEDYKAMLKEAFENRWIDLANNIGKSTGAFCSSPYGSHSYILSSFSGLMSDCLTLSHELGHAGASYYSNKEQRLFSSDPSMYFVEAPSTANEIIMELFLLKNAKTDEDRAWVLAQIISKTYFHNFVTHFMEGYYQREVYKMLDSNEAITADTLSKVFKETLEKFWADSLEIPEGAELTWMRQPHYYMGLYPYTYSAGLTIGTKVALNIDKDPSYAKVWIDTLKLGAYYDPMGLAKASGVDISTDKPLTEVIEFIGKVIDELDKLIK
ncbi:oligoendopeptidase F [Citroniella saccharovorans]|uniref:Oligopeptidase F n=1 Tax=Citroniella saccharovorans TaxID=2053367 RepID=A0AAW9N1R1_9FIRM|nr:oligoendopeptidase F [Citroniella saccharovorans]MEB3430212.1 oligoendopeptidase F [Citroniella saccharovorans]